MKNQTRFSSVLHVQMPVWLAVLTMVLTSSCQYPGLPTEEPESTQQVVASPPSTPTATQNPTDTVTPRSTTTPLITPTPPPSITSTTPITWTNPKDGAIYVYVPAGEFIMGSADSDSMADSSEKPQHTLYLGAFWIMQTEVTNAQYKRCVEDKGVCTSPSGGSWKEEAYAEYPVAYVTWYQALDYAKWAGGRLPTEAEWEKACRGVDGSIYPWGDEPPPDPTRCNYNNNRSDTTPVNQYPNGASPYGLLNMAGNVWEWTSSLWGTRRDTPDFRYPYNPADGRENQDAPYGVMRVSRGGSLYDNERFVRCAYRVMNDPRDNAKSMGFRVISLIGPGS